MSEIYIVWADDANLAQAKLELITKGETFRVLRRGRFPLIQAEDLDKPESLDSGGERYCIVFEMT